MSATGNVHSGAFDGRVRDVVFFPRASDECRALEARYPGIRFNCLRVMLFNLPRFTQEPDADYVDIAWSLSGSSGDLLRHRFHEPCRFLSRTRTRVGWRFEFAYFNDALDRLAGTLMPPLLAPFQQKESRS